MLELSNSVANFGNPQYLIRAFEKAENSEAFKIVYIGGSITQGCNASCEESRYVNLITKWWKERFPDTEISFFNAGIGATDSRFGAARVDEHVLKLDPDFVFAEYSVNDKNTPEFMDSYESLIRKILTYPTVKGLLLINNLYYDSGKNAQGIHGLIARHYDLPQVSVKDHFYPKFLCGELVPEDYTEDMLHPNDKGHKIVAELVCDLLEKYYELYKNNALKFAPPKFPKPFTQCRWENNERYNSNNSTPVLQGFAVDKNVPSQWCDPFRNGWLGREVGDKLTFEVAGREICVQYKKTPFYKAPSAEVIVDGEKCAVLDGNFDEDWGNYLALEKIYSGDEGTHTVTVQITQGGEGEFMLASFIVLK